MTDGSGLQERTHKDTGRGEDRKRRERRTEKERGKKVESERQSGWENNGDPTCTHVHKV